MDTAVLRAAIGLVLLSSAGAQTIFGCGEAFTDNYADCSPMLHLCTSLQVSACRIRLRLTANTGTCCIKLLHKLTVGR